MWDNRRDIGMWLGLEGGLSDTFTFPEIGAKKVDLSTEKGKEGHRLVVGDEQPLRKPVKN